MRQPVLRQHETTTIPELVGRRCTRFLAVQEEDDTGPLYIELDGSWHRFYLDAGVLFWEEGAAPHFDDDLWGGTHYADLATRLGVIGVPLAHVAMGDNVLRIEFANGARLRLRHAPRDEATSIDELSP